MTTVVNLRLDEPYDVYIGRPSIWGNPFTWYPLAHEEALKRGEQSYLVANRREAIRRYARWVQKQWFISKLPELKGKRLGCWCTPKLCHGHILKRLVERL